TWATRSQRKVSNVLGVSDGRAQEEREVIRRAHNSSGNPCVCADPNAVSMDVRPGNSLGDAIALLKFPIRWYEWRKLPAHKDSQKAACESKEWRISGQTALKAPIGRPLDKARAVAGASSAHPGARDSLSGFRTGLRASVGSPQASESRCTASGASRPSLAET